MSKLGSFTKKERQAGSIDDLSTDGLVLFNFLTLLVDIKYRAKYGRPIEWDRGKDYSKAMIDNEVLPDQTRSVDSGLEGLPSTEHV